MDVLLFKDQCLEDLYFLCLKPILHILALLYFLHLFFYVNFLNLELLLIPVLKLVPLVIIATFVCFSCYNNCLEFFDSKFLYKSFKVDFYYQIGTFILCVILGTVEGITISLFLSAFLVLSKFSNPVIKYKSN